MVPPGGGAVAGPTGPPGATLAGVGRTAAGTRVTQVPGTSSPVVSEPGPEDTESRGPPSPASPPASLRAEQGCWGRQSWAGSNADICSHCHEGPGASARPLSSRAAGVLDGEAWWKGGSCSAKAGWAPGLCLTAVRGSRVEKLRSFCDVKTVLAPTENKWNKPSPSECR